MGTIILTFIAILILIISIILLLKQKDLEERISNGDRNQELISQIEKLQETLGKEIKESRQETMNYIQGNFKNLGELLTGSQKQVSVVQDKRLADLNEQLTQRHDTLQQTVNNMLKHINDTMEGRLISIQKTNEEKLEQMRETVDEKLQKTLEDRISQSFKLVSERLEQVYKGLGEMQNLASGVGDLKKVLSNVKTRGILGEIQLGAILEEILSPEQYDENVAIKKGSRERVEYAIRLPGDEEDVVYLPIDAKFPADTYNRLLQAYEDGNTSEIEEATTNLERTIKSFAKSISDKYIDPPKTTEFAIMFLPFEGLYAEVVRRGLVETLQRDYRISIAGPTTMGALLNSLHMGFRTLAIQKHSSEVWDVLGAVKTEFDRFGKVLEQTQQRINQANVELDRLVGVRTRKIQSKLRNVTSLSEVDAQSILGKDYSEDD